MVSVKFSMQNSLENKIGDIPHTGNGFSVQFKPFQIRSFLVYF